MGIRSRASAAAATASDAPADSPADKENVARTECKVPENRIAPCRQQREPAAGRGAPALELDPRIVARDRQGVEIVHAGATKAGIAEPKASRLDDRRVDAEAGASAHNRAGVLGDVRLEQGQEERRGRWAHRLRAGHREKRRDSGRWERKARTRRKAKGRRGLVLWTSNSINAKSRLNCRPAWLCAERKAPTESAMFICGLSRRATPPMNP